MFEAFRHGVATAVALVLLGGTAYAAARSPLFPLTRCGPELEALCPIHGYFDAVPFHYSFAIYPGCLRSERVQTPHGLRRRLVLVCG